LDEAAAIDGAGYIRFIFQIIIPEMRPALAAFGIFGFIYSWNSLILPIVMLPAKHLWPVTLGLYSFMGEHVQNWPMIAAATVIVALPIVVVFVALQKNLIEGVAGGAAAGSQGVGGGADANANA
jgi:raffinose/stachyose/melibiose transport system permease protein